MAERTQHALWIWIKRVHGRDRQSVARNWARSGWAEQECEEDGEQEQRVHALVCRDGCLGPKWGVDNEGGLAGWSAQAKKMR